MISGRGGYWRFWAIVPLVAAGTLLPGCSMAIDELPRQPISGRVLFDGKPLPHGMIMFYPEEMSTRAHERVEAGSAITRGWFSVPREKGPVPGKYKISVTSEKELKRQARIEREASPAPPPPPVSHQEIIPERFNAKTELEIEIKEGGIVELKIELPRT